MMTMVNSEIVVIKPKKLCPTCKKEYIYGKCLNNHLKEFDNGNYLYTDKLYKQTSIKAFINN